MFCRVNPLENIAFTWRHHHYRSKGLQNFGLCSHSAYGFLAEGKKRATLFLPTHLNDNPHLYSPCKTTQGCWWFFPKRIPSNYSTLDPNKINSGPTVWYPFEYLIAETINWKWYWISRIYLFASNGSYKSKN